VGTGSGVLLIAALKMGARRAVGVDVDPCAVAEARENVRCNRLEDRASLVLGTQEAAAGRFDLVTANLRLPSLIRMAGTIGSVLAAKGGVVLSGVQTEELEDVSREYRRAGLRRVWTAEEKGWVGVWLQKAG
jgi:ribosomal protein L11 methyltransferase